MKTLKNFEAVFTVAVAIACSASYASFLQAPAAAVEKTAQTATTMHVVTVTAKRMTAQEKQLSLLEERQAQLSNKTASIL